MLLEWHPPVTWEKRVGDKYFSNLHIWKYCLSWQFGGSRILNCRYFVPFRVLKALICWFLAVLLLRIQSYSHPLYVILFPPSLEVYRNCIFVVLKSHSDVPCGSILIHCAGHSRYTVGFQNLATRVLQFWEIFLTYFINEFLAIIFSVLPFQESHYSSITPSVFLFAHFPSLSFALLSRTTCFIVLFSLGCFCFSKLVLAVGLLWSLTATFERSQIPDNPCVSAHA